VKTLTGGISVLDFGEFEVIFLNFAISYKSQKRFALKFSEITVKCEGSNLNLG